MRLGCEEGGRSIEYGYLEPIQKDEKIRYQSLKKHPQKKLNGSSSSFRLDKYSKNAIPFGDLFQFGNPHFRQFRIAAIHNIQYPSHTNQLAYPLLIVMRNDEITIT
jgi:hypothetical protein